MSDKVVSDEEARVLRCAYCLFDGKEMVDHRQLKCSHSLCLDCQHKAMFSQKECKVFTCPLCIKNHDLFSVERDDSFPACPNVVKGEGLSEEADITHCCITCADEGIRRAADTFCTDCKNLFCVSHTKMHEKANNFPSSTVKHELIPVKMYCKSKGKFSSKFCPHHPEKKLDGMCVICKEFNCITCRSFTDECRNGNVHKNKPLKDLEGETTMKLTIAMKPVMRLIEEQKMHLEESDRMMEHKEKEFAQMLVDVDQVMENQLKEIRTNYSQLKTIIDELREENIQRKNIYQDQAQEKIKMLQNLIDDVNMSLETKHLVDILQEEEALCEKLTASENVELVSLELTNVELRRAERSRSIELQLGSAADSKSPLESRNEKSSEPEAKLTSADANLQAERFEAKAPEAKPLLKRKQLESSVQRNKEVRCPQLSPPHGWTNISSVPAAPLAGVTVTYFCGFTNTTIFLFCSFDGENTTGTWNDSFSVCSDDTGHQQPLVDDSPANQAVSKIISITVGGSSLLVLGAIVSAFVVTTQRARHLLEIKLLKDKSSELETKLAAAESKVQAERSQAKALEKKYLLEIKQLKDSLRREKVENNKKPSVALMKKVQVKQTAYCYSIAVENNRKPTITLTRKIPVKEGFAYCVSHTTDGQLVVGRNGRFRFLDESGKILRSVETPGGHITGLLLYKGCVYVIHKAPGQGSERRVQKYSLQGKLMTSWKVPDYKFISQLAVVQDRVYTRSDGKNLLLAYSLTGEQQPEHNVPLSAVPHPDYLCAAPPDGLIISDLVNNLVAKYTTSGQHVWIYKGLNKPTGASIDEYNRVWVATNDSRIHILSPEGEFICELTVPDIKNMWQLSISGDQLACAAHTDGLLLYSVEY